MTPEPITLRPVTPADEPFLLKLYATTRADEMALVPWSEEQKEAFVTAQFNAQQQHYKKAYPGASHDVILSNDRRVGQLYLARMDSEMRIVDLLLLPSDRNRGIGSYLIEKLQAEGARRTKPLRVYVESFNPSIHLFERLGFSRSGEQGVHILMEWSPGRDHAAPSEINLK